MVYNGKIFKHTCGKLFDVEHSNQSYGNQGNATLPSALLYFQMPNPHQKNENSYLQITNSTHPLIWRSGMGLRGQEKY
jgi:hypothetical protein